MTTLTTASSLDACRPLEPKVDPLAPEALAFRSQLARLVAQAVVAELKPFIEQAVIGAVAATRKRSRPKASGRHLLPLTPKEKAAGELLKEIGPKYAEIGRRMEVAANTAKEFSRWYVRKMVAAGFSERELVKFMPVRRPRTQRLPTDASGQVTTVLRGRRSRRGAEASG
jgi:hypothetical protein